MRPFNASTLYVKRMRHQPAQLRPWLQLASLAMALSCCSLALAADNQSLTTAQSIAIIVQRSQNNNPLDSAELALIFLRKKLYWADGKRIQPVNLPTSNALRRQFSLAILNSLPESQADYWNSMYFHGVSPPYVVASQEAILRFIAETSGAIGYVATCKVDSRVKAVLWISTEGEVSNVPPAIECLSN